VSLGSHRRDYLGAPLLESDAKADPLEQFLDWFRAIETLEEEPTAMTLATVSADGQPSARMVLLKGVDARGFTFFTNYDSRKGGELAANPRASLLFYWRSVERQVRVEGRVERVGDAESDAYFMTRPLEARWSAYASPQSRPVDGRSNLEGLVDEVRQRFGEGVARPAWWGGFRVRPHAYEFWQGRPNRLHDRLRYESSDGNAWRRYRLAP
jgi:pyridoxamine 5'-phosphate oxidase